MYAKPTCPTPLKIVILAIIAIELAFIGFTLVTEARAGEGGAPAPEETAQPAPAPADNHAPDAAAPEAGADAAAPEPVALTVTFAGDCTLGSDVNFDGSRSFNSKYAEVQDPA